jgi:peptidoglycan/xylan/chitin deacetylase (PgdA/CDA1 family)
MIQERMLAGMLPARAVCLTFDDGPGAPHDSGDGPRTVELAEYLASQGIAAAFFMCGKHVDEHPGIPAQVLAFGHRVGNHAYTHVSLPALLDAVIRAEIRGSMNTLVRAGVPLPMPFRPPFGHWDARCASAVMADADLAAGHEGVYGWDIDGSDWDAWGRGVPDGQGVAEDYRQRIRANGGGMVLMHDSSADPVEHGQRLRAGNHALDAVRRLVPMLVEDGFTFVPLPT